MDDPRRLLDDPETSPLARSLLSSARDDGPSSDHRSAAARRLGIAAITLAGGSKAGGAAVATLWWKAGLVVVAIGSVIGIAVVVRSMDLAGSAATDRARLARTVSAETGSPVVAPSDTAPPASGGVAAPMPSEIVAPSTPDPVVAPSEPVSPRAKRPRKTTPATEPATPPAPTPTALEPAVAAPAPAPPAQVDARRLAAEVAVLDRARGALKRRDTTAALAALDEHRRDFHDGALVAEAELVRLEALIQAGRTEAARDHARSFLDRFPKSPLARRVRSLVESLKETP